MGSDGAIACVMGDMDLVRPLGLAGIRCAVVAQRDDATRFSRFTDRVLRWSDAWEHPTNLVEVLMRFGSEQPAPPALFYQQDRELLMVSRHRERLSHAFRFVLPAPDLVEALVDKARFQELAAERDLPVPAARLLRPAAHREPPALGLRFPIILKPVTRRTDQWMPVGGRSKAMSVRSMEMLHEVWPRLRAADLPIIAQELVPGSERCIESYHVYVDESGIVVADFTGRKMRTRPTRFGHTTALEITAIPDVARIGRRIAEQLDLRGVAKLDFKRAADGRLYLLEINPRFTLWHHAGAVAGVNIPALVFGDLVGRKRPVVRVARSGVYWSKPWQDVWAAWEEGVPALEWLRWTWRCDSRKLLAWDDPLPLMAGALARGASRLTRRGAPQRGMHRAHAARDRGHAVRPRRGSPHATGTGVAAPSAFVDEASTP